MKQHEIIWNSKYSSEINPANLEAFQAAVNTAISGQKIIQKCIVCCIFDQEFSINRRDILNLKISEIHHIRTVLEITRNGDLKSLIVNFPETFFPLMTEHLPTLRLIKS